MKVVSNAPEQMKRACAAALLGAVALSSVAGPKYLIVLIKQNPLAFSCFGPSRLTFAPRSWIT
jgi:hypothetical protein